MVDTHSFHRELVSLHVFLTVLLIALGLLCYVHLDLYGRHKSLNAELRRMRDEADSYRRSLEQLRHRERLKDDFISEVSHELRTPLTSIRGALGLLSSGVLGKVDDRPANLLRIASNNTDRLVRLVNDILDLQRMESGAAPLQLRSSKVGELLHQAVETMSPMAEASGVGLIIEAADCLEQLTIASHPDRMLQVLCNLLSNAIKFSPPKAVVYLRSAVDNDTLVISVEDRGRGVPADKLEMIFDRFSQVDPADAHQKGGTGLGLAICRVIVTQHGGTIHAERNDSLVPERPGATLVIRLPLLAGKPLLTSDLRQVLA